MAETLGLPAGSYEVRSNQGGIAVSGEVTLHAEALYVQLSESAVSRGVSMLYRSCDSRKDYCGHQNHFASMSGLNEASAQKRLIDALLSLQRAALRTRAQAA